MDQWCISDSRSSESPNGSWPMTTYQSVLLNIILALLIVKEDASTDLSFRFQLPTDKYELLVALVQSCRRWGMFSYLNMLGRLDAHAPLALIWVNTEEIKRFGLALYKVCRLSTCSGMAGESADGRSNELLTLADLSFCMPDSDELWNTRVTTGDLDVIERTVSTFIPQEEILCDWDKSNKVPRICGAWVGVLPQLARTTQTRDRVLSLAIAAFSSCLELKPDVRSIQIYNTSIEAVRYELSTQGREVECYVHRRSYVFDLDRGSVFRCIYTVFHSVSKQLAQIAGVLHSLFTGFRPLLLLQGIQPRKETFIALSEWIDIPFSTGRPSFMQRLISYTAPLPSLLQQSEFFLASPCERDLD
ncbi:hypothetical protein PISL3812_05557 [Talaromyces islandicus]|uniref:Uncharacterized protein n=1 Tax=Talaromyces islandicus TaxID=28573 RepID=A0A0U1M021_TALIS|nr:hypothetical protein PISL3812_05557 [Talaromyces islandicus]